MARFSTFGAILLTLNGLRLNASDAPAAAGQGTRKPAGEAAEQGGPALEGRITDKAGLPLRGAKVVLYGGMATRWKIAEAETDADGRYRFDSVQSTLIKDRETNRWDQYVGVRIEHPTHVEADGQSWRNIRIPGAAGHVETLDLRLTPAGHIDGLLKDRRTGEPLKKLDLRIMTPTGSHGHGATFHAYARTDDRGRFRSISLFPGEYDVEVNSTTLDYLMIGRVKVEPGKTTSATFDAVSLPRVLNGRILDAAGKPVDGVEVTLLAPKDSGVEPSGPDDFMKVRTRAWTIFRPGWQDRFELAFLPGLEGSRFVLAVHRELGWAKVPVASLEEGEPIRLRPWKP
jgi:protocatechuate 3,4-dioxygenase beta subunit